jgi:flagellar protein FliL
LKGLIVSDAPAEGAKPAKSKKLMVIVLAAVVLLAVAGGGAWFLLKPKAEDADVEAVKPKAAAAPPTYLPLESVVVNLADPGGDRFVQIGITLEISDAKSADTVKSFMPAIRSGILMVVSQRTTQELLQLEGKEKLAADIKREVSRPLGFEIAEEADPEEQPAPKKGAKGKADKKPKKKTEANPVQRVLFSSFIVQ